MTMMGRHPTKLPYNWNAWYHRMAWGEVFWWATFVISMAVAGLIVYKHLLAGG